MFIVCSRQTDYPFLFMSTRVLPSRPQGIGHSVYRVALPAPLSRGMMMLPMMKQAIGV